MKKHIIYLTLIIAVLLLVTGCKNNNKKETGLTQVWSEKNNDLDRCGLDLQLCDDGNYYFGELTDEGEYISFTSYGTWTSTESSIVFTPLEKYSVFVVDDKGEYKVDYSLDKKENCLQFTYVTTDGKNTYSQEAVLYGNGTTAKSDSIQNSGLLYRWADYEENIEITFYQYADAAMHYKIIVSSIDGNEIYNGDVVNFTDDSFEINGSNVKIEYSLNGKNGKFIINGKTYNMIFCKMYDDFYED